MDRILVIEDDATLNKNIQEALSAEGFLVESAFDGAIAEKMLRKNPYHCVVLDINLPHKNGYDICRQFRTYDTCTPVLFLTAFDDLEDKVQGYDVGADDYLTKPFFMKELFLRIRSLMKRSQQKKEQQHNALLVFDDICIHTASKKVKRKDVEINLTPREYEIMLMLVEAQGELVSKNVLIEHIWGKSIGINTNTIEVHINLLRNKVDKPFHAQTIKTRVGYGYYLESKK